MAKPSLTVLQKNYLKRIDALQRSSASFRDLLATVEKTGENYVAQKRRLEDKVFDEQWVEELELGFNSLDRILANPRKFIKEEEEVVLAALAKRVTSASIVHLASHTQFVHSVDAYGNVTPERILSVSTEEDIQIYENRFVMSLIQKLAIFIEKRYQFIKSHGETRNSDVLLIHSKTEIDGVRYEVDNRIKISVPSSDNGMAEKNNDLLTKIGSLRERVVYYLHSPFMSQMSGSKPVHNPVAMTNLLLKNPDYHKAYELWRFIDNYEKLGVTYSVKETNQAFDKTYFQEIYSLILANMLTLKAHEIEGKSVEAPGETRRKVLEPKTLLTLEDETFLDGRFAYDQFPDLKALIEPKEDLTKKEGEERLAPTPEMVRLMRETAAEKQKRDLIRAKEIRDRQQVLRDKQEREEAEQAVLRKKKLDELVAKAQAQEAATQKKEEERRLRELAFQQAKEAQEASVREEKLLEQARNEIQRAAFVDKVLDKKTAEELSVKEASLETSKAISSQTAEAPRQFSSPTEPTPLSFSEAQPAVNGASLTEVPSPVQEKTIDSTTKAISQPQGNKEAQARFEVAITPESKMPEAPSVPQIEAEIPFQVTAEKKPEEVLASLAANPSKVLFVLEKAERVLPTPENKPVLYFSPVKNSKPGEASEESAKRVSLPSFPSDVIIKNVAKPSLKPAQPTKEETKAIFAFALKKESAKPMVMPKATSPGKSPIKKGLFVTNVKEKVEAPQPVTSVSASKKVFLTKSGQEKRK